MSEVREAAEKILVCMLFLIAATSVAVFAAVISGQPDELKSDLIFKKIVIVQHVLQPVQERTFLGEDKPFADFNPVCIEDANQIVKTYLTAVEYYKKGDEEKAREAIELLNTQLTEFELKYRSMPHWVSSRADVNLAAMYQYYKDKPLEVF